MSAGSSRSAVPSAHTGLDRVLADITGEREAQHAVWGVQHHLPDGTGPQWLTPAEEARRECEQAASTKGLAWRHILCEEVAEALAEDDPVRLRCELVQVAAVVVQWIQALDHRGKSAKPEGNPTWQLPPNSSSPATAKPPATSRESSAATVAAPG